MSIADKLTTVAENVPKVYEAGKKSKYDAFWDTYQRNGLRRDYSYAFYGRGWNKDTFKPKYPIFFEKTSNEENPTWARMFENFALTVEYMPEKVDFSNIEIDFSAITDADSLFKNASVMNLYCDFSNVTTIYYCFGSPNRGRIDNLTLKVSEKCTNFNYAFYYQNITTLIFEDGSVIAANGLNLTWATSLTKESIVSIINALSATTSGLTVTLSKTAVTNAFGGVDSAEWQALIATKSNWTISLV